MSLLFAHSESIIKSEPKCSHQILDDHSSTSAFPLVTMHQYASTPSQSFINKLVTLLKIDSQVGLLTVLLSNVQIGELLWIPWLAFVVYHKDVAHFTMAQYLQTLRGKVITEPQASYDLITVQLDIHATRSI